MSRVGEGERPDFQYEPPYILFFIAPAMNFQKYPTCNDFGYLKDLNHVLNSPPPIHPFIYRNCIICLLSLLSKMLEIWQELYALLATDIEKHKNFGVVWRTRPKVSASNIDFSTPHLLFSIRLAWYGLLFSYSPTSPPTTHFHLSSFSHTPLLLPMIISLACLDTTIAFL